VKNIFKAWFYPKSFKQMASKIDIFKPSPFLSHSLNRPLIIPFPKDLLMNFDLIEDCERVLKCFHFVSFFAFVDFYGLIPRENLP
jgi:hypothetical protein